MVRVSPATSVNGVDGTDGAGAWNAPAPLPVHAEIDPESTTLTDAMPWLVTLTSKGKVPRLRLVCGTTSVMVTAMRTHLVMPQAFRLANEAGDLEIGLGQCETTGAQASSDAVRGRQTTLSATTDEPLDGRNRSERPPVAITVIRRCTRVAAALGLRHSTDDMSQANGIITPLCWHTGAPGAAATEAPVTAAT